jgi:5-methylthioadenosine/S-adenosylhomocysteine deaminase
MGGRTVQVIRGGRLLDPPRHRGELGDLLVDGDTIREVGTPELAAPADAREVDARDRLLMPGLVNAHTHAHGALAKGLIGDRWPLELLLNVSPATNAERTLEDQRLSAMLSAVEMVRKGATACLDLCVEFPGPSVDGILAVAHAYGEVGMRAVVAPMVSDRTLYEAVPGLIDAVPEPLRGRVAAMRAAPARTILDVSREIARRWPFDRAQLRPALGPTIPLHCSDELLEGCRDLGREWDLPLQTHLAESRIQAVMGVRRYGHSLTAHLGSLGVLGPTMSAAHAIWIDEDDMRRLADAGVAAVHNPLSNLRLGSGVAPVTRLRAHGVRVALGTDAANTSDSQSMFEATRLAAYLSRVRDPDPDGWLSVDDALHMATAAGGEVLGFGDSIGRLAPGARADLVVLDLRHISYVPLHDAALQVVSGESGLAIESVMIGGRWVLRDGTMQTVDEPRLRQRAAEAALRLGAATADRRAFARSLEPWLGGFCRAYAHTPGAVARPWREPPDPP